MRAARERACVNFRGRRVPLDCFPKRDAFSRFRRRINRRRTRNDESHVLSKFSSGLKRPVIPMRSLCTPVTPQRGSPLHLTVPLLPKIYWRWVLAIPRLQWSPPRRAVGIRAVKPRLQRFAVKLPPEDQSLRLSMHRLLWSLLCSFFGLRQVRSRLHRLAPTFQLCLQRFVVTPRPEDPSLCLIMHRLP